MIHKRASKCDGFTEISREESRAWIYTRRRCHQMRLRRGHRRLILPTPRQNGLAARGHPCAAPSCGRPSHGYVQKKPTGMLPVGPNHKIFGVTPERRTTRLTPSSLARWETSRMPL